MKRPVLALSAGILLLALMPGSAMGAPIVALLLVDRQQRRIR